MILPFYVSAGQYFTISNWFANVLQYRFHNHPWNTYRNTQYRIIDNECNIDTKMAILVWKCQNVKKINHKIVNLAFVYVLKSEKVQIWISPSTVLYCVNIYGTLHIEVRISFPHCVLLKHALMYFVLFGLFFFYCVTYSDHNECLGVNKCSIDANCINTNGSYTCQCKPGYQGDGVSCSGNSWY